MAHDSTRGHAPTAPVVRFISQHDVSCAIGRRRNGGPGFSRATLGYFDRDRKQYREIPVEEQVEVLSLLGDLVLEDGEPKVHVHVVLGRADGTTVGGHLLEGQVWPTLEVVLSEAPGALRKRVDPETGLALIDLDAG